MLRPFAARKGGFTMMNKAESVAQEFMRKLNQDEIKREIRPNNGPTRDNEYVEKQVAEFHGILESGIPAKMLEL